MGLPNAEAQQVGAITGYQEQLTGTIKSVAGVPTLDDLEQNQLPLIGKVLGVGTYYFAMPCAGASALDCTLRASAGAAVATIYRTLADHITEKMDAAGASAAVAFGAFVVGTSQTKSITALRGEKVCLLKIVVAVAGFTLDQAFYSAL
jgi:hypothetical protein